MADTRWNNVYDYAPLSCVLIACMYAVVANGTPGNQPVDTEATAPATGDVKFLADGFTYGLLEYFDADDQWKLLCEKGLDENAAKVACSKLGYDEARKLSPNMFYSEDNKDMVNYRFNCNGTESSLVACKNSTIDTACTATSTNYLALHCYGSSADLIIENDTQLTDGVLGLENVLGRVEIEANGVWSNICADDWSNEKAKVLCKELGEGGGTALRYAPTQGSAYYPGDITCSGDEDLLSDCPSATSRSCEIAQDTAVGGVLCHNATAIRVHDEEGFKGLVQIVFGVQTGTICGTDWGANEAQVVCKSMGKTFIGSKTGALHESLDSAKMFLLGHVKCTGTEASLLQCTISGDVCKNNSLHAYAVCSTDPVTATPSPEDTISPTPSLPELETSLDQETSSSSIAPTTPDIIHESSSTISQIQETTTQKVLEPSTTSLVETDTTTTHPTESTTSTETKISEDLAETTSSPIEAPSSSISVSIEPTPSTSGSIPITPGPTPQPPRSTTNAGDKQIVKPEHVGRGPNVGAIVGVVLVLVIVLAIGGYVFWKKRHHVFKHERLNEGFVRFDSEKTTLDIAY